MKLFRHDGHLTDEAMLLLDERDLDDVSERRAESHLAACNLCAQHRSSLRVLASRYIPEISDPVAGGAEARRRLQAALDQETAAQDTEASRWWCGRDIAALVQPQLLLRVGAVVALLVAAFAFRAAYSPTAARMAAWEDTGPEPNRALTPGASNPVELARLCTLKDDDLDPQVSPDKQREVFHAYGMDEKAARAYQVDYLINPQLGGNDQIENLWPEPYHATVWNASAKDALETRLHGMVCSGQLSLEDAQHDLATDWIAAYKKYFHASRPPVTEAKRFRGAQPLMARLR